MLRPMEFWVGNARTVWVDLLIRNSWDFSVANEALSLYQDHERTSKMDYQIWSAIYPSLGASLIKLGRIGATEARRQKVATGELTFMWADAIASALYSTNKRALKAAGTWTA